MGLESLATVTLHALQQKTVRRALIIAFDSSFPFAVGSDRLDHFPEGFTLFNYDMSRIPGIMEERALAYRRLYFRTMTEQGVLPDERRLKFLQLRHIDAVWKDDMSDLPDSCKNEEVKLTNPPMVKKRLANVVTRLWLESACDRDLVATAAAKLVEGTKTRSRNSCSSRFLADHKPSFVFFIPATMEVAGMPIRPVCIEGQSFWARPRRFPTDSVTYSYPAS